MVITLLDWLAQWAGAWVWYEDDPRCHSRTLMIVVKTQVSPLKVKCAHTMRAAEWDDPFHRQFAVEKLIRKIEDGIASL